MGADLFMTLIWLICWVFIGALALDPIWGVALVFAILLDLTFSN